jgi:mannitol-1-phosphate/altronate dehydrogenase
MNQSVQFGAGNIGRGFIGHLLWEEEIIPAIESIDPFGLVA